MKNKLKNILILVSIVFLTTGCVKFNTNVDIHKDKSMDLSVIYAIDSTYFQDEELFTAEDKNKFTSKGYNVEEYNEDNMKGLKLNLSISNIDKVSIPETTAFNVSKILDTESNEPLNNVFTVKKGLLKNKYTAKFEFDSSDSGLNPELDNENDSNLELDDNLNIDSDLELDDNLSDDLDNNDEEIITDDEDNSIDSDFNLDGMTSTMDLSFNVNLPYKAISNNATEVTNDGKSLKWELTTDEISYMEFSFELYNYTTIYIGIAVIIIIIILLIVFLLMQKKKNNKNNSQLEQNLNPTNTTLTEQSPNENGRTLMQQNINASTQLNNPTVNQQNVAMNNLNTNQVNTTIPTPVINNIPNNGINQNSSNNPMPEQSPSISMNLPPLNPNVTPMQPLNNGINQNTIPQPTPIENNIPFQNSQVQNPTVNQQSNMPNMNFTNYNN